MPPTTTIKQYQNDPYEQYTRKVASAESGGKTTAKNPFGAAGLFQFVPSTWRNLNDKYKLGYSQDDRLDPEKSKKVMKLFTEENKKQLSKRLGRQPDDYELYLAHGFGAAGAGRLIEGVNKNPNIRTDQFFSPIILKQNKALLYNKDGSAKTLGDIANHFKAKMSAPVTNYTNSEKEITPEETVENLKQVNNRLTDLVFTKELPNFAGISYVPEEDENIKKLEEKEVEKEQFQQREQQVAQAVQQQEELPQEDIADYYVDPNQTYAEIDSFLQMQSGGTIYVNSKNDTRYKAYQDSLQAYEIGERNKIKNAVRTYPFDREDVEAGALTKQEIDIYDRTGILPTKEYVGKLENSIFPYSYGYDRPRQTVALEQQQQRMPQRTVKINPQGLEYSQTENPSANPEIFMPFQMPRSFTISEYNQRMNNQQGYGSGRYDDNADLEKLKRALEAQEKYNEEIERRYNNTEAQKNPKAQERYNTLRNNVTVIPNYLQSGGFAYRRPEYEGSAVKDNIPEKPKLNLLELKKVLDDKGEINKTGTLKKSRSAMYSDSQRKNFKGDTEVFFNEAEKALDPYQYQRLLDLQYRNGNPNISFDNKGLPFTEGRKNYNPLTNTISLPKYDVNSSHYQFSPEGYLQEISHAGQDNLTAIPQFMLRDIPAYMAGQNPYGIPGTVEFETHNIIEPKNLKYLDDYTTDLGNELLEELERSKGKEVFRPYQQGGEIPTSPLGMWQYPNQVVRVPSGNITMNFMKHPIEAVSEQTGERIILKPNEKYTFKNTTSVIEKPLK